MVSIIIPFYRNRKWLEAALESVLVQTYRDYEIIVVDDGSGILIDDLTEKYENLQIIHSENRGPASARNIGIRASKGEYVAFLDSDDLWMPDKLKKQIDFMTSENYEWSSTGYCRFDNENELKPELDASVKFYEHSGMSVWQMLASTRIATPTVIIKKTLIDENPDIKFNENLRFGEDTCLWLSLAMKSPLGYVNENLARIRMHGTNAAGSCAIQLAARVEIFDYFSALYPDATMQMPLKLRFAIKLCRIGNLLIGYLKLLTESKAFIEFAAKIVYFFPWLVFKVSCAVYAEKN